MIRQRLYTVLTIIVAGLSSCTQTENQTVEHQALAAIQDESHIQLTIEEPKQISFQALSPKQIVFANKSGTGVETGQLSSHKDSVVYYISIHAGKTMRATQIGTEDDKRISLRIFDPSGQNVSDMSASCNNNLEVSPTVQGTYRMEVTQCLKVDKWSGEYSLEVSVE